MLGHFMFKLLSDWINKILKQRERREGQGETRLSFIRKTMNIEYKLLEKPEPLRLYK